jgi:hypothetical protein
MSYCNDNGLVNGNIPAGKPCPWWKSCNMKVERCPSEAKPKEVDYSCALARLNSCIDSGKREGKKLPLLEKVRDGLK